MANVDILIESIKVFQRIKEIIEISYIAKSEYGCLKMLKQTQSYDDHTNASRHYHEIPYVRQDFVWQKVYEQIAEPFEEPQVMSEVWHVENV